MPCSFSSNYAISGAELWGRYGPSSKYYTHVHIYCHDNSLHINKQAAFGRDGVVAQNAEFLPFWRPTHSDRSMFGAPYDVTISGANQIAPFLKTAPWVKYGRCAKGTILWRKIQKPCIFDALELRLLLPFLLRNLLLLKYEAVLNSCAWKKEEKSFVFGRVWTSKVTFFKQ